MKKTYPGNPKAIRAQKEGKDPMDYLPLNTLRGPSRVLKGGADKYGRRNWREDEILATTYVGAILRHVAEWSEGSDVDADSGEHPLDHVVACCLVARDAMMNGTLIDDRKLTESKRE